MSAPTYQERQVVRAAAAFYAEEPDSYHSLLLALAHDTVRRREVQQTTREWIQQLRLDKGLQ